MWDYTKYHFKCPYCEHEYKSIVGHGITYKYKDAYYDLYQCPNCNAEFLGHHRDDFFIKMPEDKNGLKLFAIWMS